MQCSAEPRMFAKKSKFRSTSHLLQKMFLTLLWLLNPQPPKIPTFDLLVSIHFKKPYIMRHLSLDVLNNDWAAPHRMTVSPAIGDIDVLQANNQFIVSINAFIYFSKLWIGRFFWNFVHRFSPRLKWWFITGSWSPLKDILAIKMRAGGFASSIRSQSSSFLWPPPPFPVYKDLLGTPSLTRHSMAYKLLYPLPLIRPKLVKSHLALISLLAYKAAVGSERDGTVPQTTLSQ